MDLEDNRAIFWSLVIGIGVFVLLFHTIGMYALITHRKWTNQSRTLLCLSASEVAIMLVEMVLETEIRFKNVIPRKLYKFCFTLELALIYFPLFVVTILTLDRFVCALNPLKYDMRMRPRRLKAMFVIAFIVAMAIGLPARLLPHEEVGKYFDLLLVVMFSSYLIFVIVAYSFILVVIRRSRALVRSESANTNSNPRKQFLVPGLIVLTFIIFFLVPFPIRLMKVDSVKLQFVKDQTCKLMAQIGITVDPFIYTLGIPQYRAIVLRLFRKKCCCCCQKSCATEKEENVVVEDTVV